MRIWCPLFVLALLSAGCLDGSDDERVASAGPDDAGAGSGIIEEPEARPVGADLRWEDVDAFDVALEEPGDDAQRVVDLNEYPTPSMLSVHVYRDCILGAPTALLGPTTVTVAGAVNHEMDGEGADCPNAQRSRGDSFQVITLFPCEAREWTVRATGHGPGAGAEVHVQRPADPEEAQRVVDAFVAEHGDPCEP